MTEKKIVHGFLLLFTCVLIGTASLGCKKDDPVRLPEIITINATEITSTTATAGGNIIKDGGTAITAHGIVWSKVANPDYENKEGMTVHGKGKGEFTCNMSDLTPGTTYYVKAYAANSEGRAYGNQISFKTAD
jgi:hypothetical protein